MECGVVSSSAAHKAKHAIWHSISLLRKPRKLTQLQAVDHTLFSTREMRCFAFTFSELSWEQSRLQLQMQQVAHVCLVCHLLRWGVWSSPDTLCMGGLLFTADKAQILGITWRYHVTPKMELLFFSSKTYSVSPGQRTGAQPITQSQNPLKIYASLNYWPLNYFLLLFSFFLE